MESGFYYLQSRYYDPYTKRFINSDSAISTGKGLLGYNMFSYCLNNPVIMSDPQGEQPNWAKNIVGVLKNATNKIVLNVKTVASSVNLSIQYAKVGISNSLPLKGKPDSSQTSNNPDGSPKQKRWYGPDGLPIRDRDYNHPGSMEFPHDHTWKNGIRNKDHTSPSPDYQICTHPLLGIALIGGCAIGIAVVAIDDLTGVGVIDDGLIAPLSVGVGYGMAIVFP